MTGRGASPALLLASQRRFEEAIDGTKAFGGTKAVWRDPEAPTPTMAGVLLPRGGMVQRRGAFVETTPYWRAGDLELDHHHARLEQRPGSGRPELGPPERAETGWVTNHRVPRSVLPDGYFLRRRGLLEGLLESLRNAR